MNIDKINRILSFEPKYRVQQIFGLIFNQNITDWDQASTLPKKLREELENSISLDIPAKIQQTQDTTKALITLTDDNKIEAVLMRHENRNTVCVSTQVGCALKCTFCATGKMGFKRNLTTYEILEQVVYFNRLLAKEDKRVTNIVFMGMGEPLLNYQNVLESIKILHDEKLFNIGLRRISVSTVGIIDGIRKLAIDLPQVNLAISLHAPNDILRQQLIPSAENTPIKELLKAIDEYIEKTNRKVMVEYMLIKNVNDEIEHAKELCKILKGKLVVINLIPYNPTNQYEASSPEYITAFKKILVNNRLNVTERFRHGREIDAACGQLATKSKQ